MVIRPSQSVTALFETRNADGEEQDADSTPTGTLYVNGASNGATVTVANVATGLYKFAVTIPSDLAAGDVAQVRVTATVDEVTGRGLVWLGGYPTDLAAVRTKTDYLPSATAGTTSGLPLKSDLPASSSTPEQIADAVQVKLVNDEEFGDLIPRTPEIAAAILVTPANKIRTLANGEVVPRSVTAVQS
jgi:hypothetical protein